MTAIQLQNLILGNLRLGEDIVIPMCEQGELFNDIKELYTAIDKEEAIERLQSNREKMAYLFSEIREVEEMIEHIPAENVIDLASLRARRGVLAEKLKQLIDAEDIENEQRSEQ